MRLSRPVVMSFGVGLGVLTAPGLSHAQPAGARAPTAHVPIAEMPSEVASNYDAERTAEARQRYQEGNAAMKLHQWQKAYDAYLVAWRAKPHWQVAGSLGQVELKLARNRDAATHLALFLREAKDVPPEEIKHAREWLDQARAKIAVLTIDTPQAGAEILIDGLKVGQTPLREEMYVEPGKHLVEGHLGQCAATSEVDLPAGGSREVALRCAIAAPPSGDVRAQTAVVPDAGGAKPSSKLSPVVIAGASVTVAALGLGVTSVALFATKGKQARESHEPASGPNATSEATFKSVAVWSFVAAGIAGGGTLLYHLKRERSSHPPVRGSLFVGPTGGVAMVQGEF